MNDIVVLNHGLEGVSLISKHSEHRDPNELQYKHTGCSSLHGMYGFELFVSWFFIVSFFNFLGFIMDIRMY